VAYRYEVADIDGGVDRRDVAVLGDSPQQRLGRAAVLCRIGAKAAEHLAPRRDRRPLSDRVGTRALGGRCPIASVRARSAAMCCSAWYSSASARGATPLVISRASTMLWRIVGKRATTAGLVVEPDHMTAAPAM
jgi:hypothetical protein